MRFLKQSLCVVACLCCGLFALSTCAQNLQVKTDKGKLQGKLSADGQVRAFLGVPFAAPPVGQLRWQPPQPAAKWSGVRDATSFGARCAQLNVYDDMNFRDSGGSEDCLKLNVWTPAKDKNANLPVMVWIYGGGFTAGATSEPRQEGEHLAHKGVIVVSMNYRLGLFGFFVHPDLAAESPHHAAGNYGLMDQTAALQWVKQNIRAFGGNPDNVTIFGESAGSFSVSAQMASPLAQGLFARAIGESGAAFYSRGLSFAPLAKRETIDPAWALAAFGTSDLAALRAMSADDLLNKMGAQKNAGRAPFSPDTDGYFLPESIPQIFKEGKQAHVPLLSGWNRDEPSALEVNTPEPPTVENFRAMAEKEFGARADDFLKAFPDTNQAELVRSAIDFAGDKFLTFATWQWLQAQVATGGSPVYRYYFARPAPADKYNPAGSGAFHSDEIEYVFGMLDSRPGAVWEPEDYKISDLMETYWTNFARTGNPNGAGGSVSSAGVPDWPQYDAAGNWEVMNLDVDSHATPDKHRAQELFLESVWAAPQP